MKRLLLFTFALLAFAGIKAQTTVQETDVSGLDYVVYMESCEYPKGTGVVDLYVRVRSAELFLGAQFNLELPADLTAENNGRLYGVEDRYDSELGEASYTSSITDQGYLKGVCFLNSAAESDARFFTTGADGNDRFCSLKVNLSELEPGEYPLIIRPGAIVSGRKSDDKPQEIETEIVSKLVITNEVILDENDTEYPGDYTGVDVKVLRTISFDNWNTLCLPIAMTADQCKEVFGENVELAEYTGYEFDESKKLINVRFTDISSITANRPLIIKIKKTDFPDLDAFTEFKLKGIDIKPAPENKIAQRSLQDSEKKGRMIGNYVNGTLLVDYDEDWEEYNSRYIFLSDNKFYYATYETKPMKGFRAYFYFKDQDKAMTAASDGVKFNFSVNDDEPTSIDGISTIEKVAEGVYNVSGQKVSDSSLEGLPKGVYIVNGKKVFKK